MYNYLTHTGTFARVWLVKLKSPRSEDRDKVYALKVLKKADGECLRSRDLPSLTFSQSSD